MYCIECGAKKDECQCGNRSRSREKRDREKASLAPSEGLDSNGRAIVAALEKSLGGRMSGLETSLNDMRADVQNRFHEVEKDVAGVKLHVNHHDREISALKDESAALKQDLQITKDAVKELQSGLPQQPILHPPSPLWTASFIGNVGWDSDGETIITNTKNFLQGIGIPTESVAQMVPVVHHESKLGSGCENYFVHSAEFEYAKSKARYMRKVQPPCTKPIFVAEKQTEEQRALKRTMLRLAECLRDAESEKPADQQHKVELKYRTKVFYKDKLAAYISKNASADECPIGFSPFGLQEFPETTRKLAVGYALA